MVGNMSMIIAFYIYILKCHDIPQDHALTNITVQWLVLVVSYVESYRKSLSQRPVLATWENLSSK